MLRPYDLLENILIDIEKGIRKDVSVSCLATQYDLSYRHLQRLFKFAFEQSLADYIRSRKLAVSLDDLLKTDSKLINIALDYGFGYEQTYIRAFKSEYGFTPGDLRKSGHIVKVKPPLHLFDENKISDGLFFGPDIVMVPQFHVVGKLHRIPVCDVIKLSAEAGLNFMENERKQIKTADNGDVFIGMTYNYNHEKEFSEYMAAVQVESFDDIPQGLSKDTFETSLCIRFRYITQHNYTDINRDDALSLYEAVSRYNETNHCKYTLLEKQVYFIKIDTSLYDGTYCPMELFAPVVEKK